MTPTIFSIDWTDAHCCKASILANARSGFTTTFFGICAIGLVPVAAALCMARWLPR